MTETRERDGAKESRPADSQAGADSPGSEAHSRPPGALGP